MARTAAPVATKPRNVFDLLYLLALVNTKTEAKRLCEAGKVKVNSRTVRDCNTLLTEFKNGAFTVVSDGQERFARPGEKWLAGA